MTRKFRLLLGVFALSACRTGARLPTPTDHVIEPGPVLPLVARQTDSAGIVTGIVHADDGVPLAYAAIRVAGRPDRIAVDSLGRFRFVAREEETLVLTTMALGRLARTDAIRLSPSSGVALELVLRKAPVLLGEVCACDPEPLLRLRLRRPSGRRVDYVITTVEGSGISTQRDSIGGTAFAGDSLERVVFWSLRSRAPRTVSVAVESPGYRPWRQRRVKLPDSITLDLAPER